MTYEEAFEILKERAVERNVHGYWLVPVWDGSRCRHVQVEGAIQAATLLLENENGN